MASKEPKVEEKRMQSFLRIRTHKAYLKARHTGPRSIFMKARSLDRRNRIALTACFFQEKPNFHCLSSNLRWHAVHWMLFCLLTKRYHEVINAYKLELSNRKNFSFILKFLICWSFIPWQFWELYRLTFNGLLKDTTASTAFYFIHFSLRQITN